MKNSNNDEKEKEDPTNNNSPENFKEAFSEIKKIFFTSLVELFELISITTKHLKSGGYQELLIEFLVQVQRLIKACFDFIIYWLAYFTPYYQPASSSTNDKTGTTQTSNTQADVAAEVPLSPKEELHDLLIRKSPFPVSLEDMLKQSSKLEQSDLKQTIEKINGKVSTALNTNVDINDRRSSIVSQYGKLSELQLTSTDKKLSYYYFASSLRNITDFYLKLAQQEKSEGNLSGGHELESGAGMVLTAINYTAKMGILIHQNYDDKTFCSGIKDFLEDTIDNLINELELSVLCEFNLIQMLKYLDDAMSEVIKSA